MEGRILDRVSQFLNSPVELYQCNYIFRRDSQLELTIEPFRHPWGHACMRSMCAVERMELMHASYGAYHPWSPHLLGHFIKSRTLDCQAIALCGGRCVRWG